MIRIEHIDAATPLGIAVVRLARPEKKNALTPAMLTELSAAVESVDASGTTRVLVLAGDGDVFCSGFDLSLCRNDERVLADLLTGLSQAVRALRSCRVPVVCAAQGAAIAGGCALLGGADFVVTDAAAKLGYPVVRLGISPSVTAPFLVHSLGYGRARERLLGGSLMDGREAARLGLAQECVEKPGEVLAAALMIAAELSEKPPAAMAATKRWLNELDGSADETSADAALAASLSLVGAAEERERLAALWKT